MEVTCPGLEPELAATTSTAEVQNFLSTSLDFLTSFRARLHHPPAARISKCCVVGCEPSTGAAFRAEFPHRRFWTNLADHTLPQLMFEIDRWFMLQEQIFPTGEFPGLY